MCLASHPRPPDLFPRLCEPDAQLPIRETEVLPQAGLQDSPLGSAVTVPGTRLACSAVAQAVCPLRPEGQGARTHVPQTGEVTSCRVKAGSGFLFVWFSWVSIQQGPKGLLAELGDAGGELAAPGT